jgi:trehalose 6-phosphate phosphatase
VPGKEALPVPATAAGRAGLAALIAAPAAALVALDFDGTLAPIVEDPAAARAAQPTTDVLARLAGAVGTVAIITGRPAAEAAEFAGLSAISPPASSPAGSSPAGPGVIVLGHYGSQRWQAGQLSGPPPPPGLAVARQELPDVLSAAGAADGIFVEDKGYAVAVHTRRAARPQQELDRLSPALAALASRAGLQVEPGRFVLELRPPGSDKGLALRGLVAERSAGAVLFCGDDRGDRPAFSAVAQLRAEGIPGLTVCSGSDEVPELAAEADLVVAGPAGVTALLAALADAVADAVAGD